MQWYVHSEDYSLFRFIQSLHNIFLSDPYSPTQIFLVYFLLILKYISLSFVVFCATRTISSPLRSTPRMACATIGDHAFWLGMEQPSTLDGVLSIPSGLSKTS